MSNSWLKSGESWVVKSDTEHKPGDVIPVMAKSGRTRYVKIGKQVGFVYSVIADENLYPADTRAEQRDYQ